MWVLGIAFASTAAALALSCGSGSIGERLANSLLTRSTEDAESEMDAILRGTLEVNSERGCILLSGRPVVWPAGTTLTTDPPELQLPGSLTAMAGDVISGRGGEVPATEIRDTSIRIEGDLNHALECAPAETQVAVFSVRGADIAVSSPEG